MVIRGGLEAIDQRTVGVWESPTAFDLGPDSSVPEMRK